MFQVVSCERAYHAGYWSPEADKYIHLFFSLARVAEAAKLVSLTCAYLGLPIIGAWLLQNWNVSVYIFQLLRKVA